MDIPLYKRRRFNSGLGYLLVELLHGQVRVLLL
jgi:hypothetical protein